ncbi:type III secretion system chaperone [Verrucomicrobium sp. BvORR034]|uniref:type III secretion system chaperone n=1 Tax=Verrucomicrobium sp. BvORR034 TaxID=1396418 RepID=UPI000679A4CE|nr:type III secretion system chaperone [Verrucomicrobium sp. BvORR034]
MSSFQTAQSLIEQFSHSVGVPGLTLDDEGSLTLRVGEGQLVQVAHDPSSGELILSAQVHPDADELPPAALRRMLVTNVKLHAESGPTFAIVPDDGTVVLEHHLSLANLEYSEFEAAWTLFLDQVERASAKLTQMAESHTAAAYDGEPLSSEQQFVIRA